MKPTLKEEIATGRCCSECFGKTRGQRVHRKDTGELVNTKATFDSNGFEVVCVPCKRGEDY